MLKCQHYHTVIHFKSNVELSQEILKKKYVTVQIFMDYTAHVASCC